MEYLLIEFVDEIVHVFDLLVFDLLDERVVEFQLMRGLKQE